MKTKKNDSKPKKKIGTLRKKYIVLEDGVDFRTISKKMSDAGWRMNHATARNQLMSAMKNLMTELSKELHLDLNDEKILDLISDAQVHETLNDVLQNMVHGKLNKNGEYK